MARCGLQEHRGGGGKGRPRTTSYSYSASFAVLLSGRPIRAVKRIWADGNLLRGSAGDWKTETGFRLHTGAEDQPVDPLIASAEGMAMCPAYRGRAYAVFEAMQLADYANRIPSLTFEIEADAGPVTVGELAAVLSGGAVTGVAGTPLAGFAATGDSVRGVLEGLVAGLPLTLAEADGALLLSDGQDAPVTLPAGGDGAQRTRVERQSAGTLPDEVAIGYYAPERDYQAGLQRARRGGPGRRVEAVELAAALSPAQAKALAEARLARDWAGRTTARVTLPWTALSLAPGMAATLPGRGERWRVAATTLEGMALSVDLIATAPATGLVPAAEAGRALAPADQPHGATRIAVLDVPAADGAMPDGTRLLVAAAGVSPGWRRAALLGSLDGGASWTTLGQTAAPAIMGVTADVPAAGDAALRDDAASVVVTLLHDGMTLAGRDDIAASAEANLAAIGEELVQFGAATRIGPATWRLSRLLRGRRGTESAMGAHVAGEPFVLIEPATLAVWDLPASAVGATAQVMASGVGDALPVVAARGVAGRALMPPSPVHLRGATGTDGTVRIGWTRRSRLGFSWRDGDEVALGEPAERYRIALSGPGGAVVRTAETDGPAFDYPPAARMADGLAGAAVTIAVRQLGGRAASPPATITIM